MTCHQALALLDDFVDNDLDQTLAGKLKGHLKTCPSCRQEHQATIRLKELLRGSKTQGPGKDYWSETTRLIMARSVDATMVDPAATTRQESITTQRNAFVRSLVSLAASVVILISAVLIGQNHPHLDYAHLNGPNHHRLFAVGPAAKQLSGDPSNFAADQQLRLARGMLLMGPPGLFGRFAMLPELSNHSALTDRQVKP